MTSILSRPGAFQWVTLVAIAMAGSVLPACADDADETGSDAGATPTNEAGTAPSSANDRPEAGPNDDVSTDSSETEATGGNGTTSVESTEGDLSGETPDASANDAGDASSDPLFDADVDAQASDAEPQQSNDAGSGDSDSGESANPTDSGSCPAGESYYTPGCGLERNPLSAGCYQACEGASDDSCQEGTVCAIADIDPCRCSEAPRGTSCCAACGAEVWLCQAPSEAQADSGCSERPGRGDRECRR